MIFKNVCIPRMELAMFKAFIEPKYPLPITKSMKDLAIETPYSLDDIANLKYHCNLTDYGVRLVIEIACQQGISVWAIIEAANL